MGIRRFTEVTKEMSEVRNIGVPGVEAPTTECDDPRCPFHGNTPRR